VDKDNKGRATACLTAGALILSGICFTLFPVIRPFFDETTLKGAAEFASVRWVLAHSFGMWGFILLCIGILGVYVRLRDTEVERRTFLVLVLSWIGAGLVLPFFGAEAFSLQVIGRTAFEQENVTIIRMVNSVRFGPGIYYVGIGLLSLAVASVIFATAIWKSRVLAKWSGVPLAVALVVYIPQLQGAPVFQPIRIIVGLLILAGSTWIAVGMMRSRKPVGYGSN
jgi:hypothetical protein